MGEAEDAKRYWAGRGVGAFSRPRPWQAGIVDAVLFEDPASVLEFGCNVGRHLAAIRERAPEVGLLGLDVNEAAVRAGVAEHALELYVGDEDALRTIEADTFDVALTVSVLDHVPNPEPALRELDRIARVLVLVEPWVGYEGPVRSLPSGSKANPFLYSWDYVARLAHRSWDVRPYPLGDGSRPGSTAGPWYRLHVGRR